MEKILEEFSLSLFIWQTVMFILLIIIIYYLRKLYIKLINYLNKNS